MYFASTLVTVLIQSKNLNCLIVFSYNLFSINANNNIMDMNIVKNVSIEIDITDPSSAQVEVLKVG